MYRFVIAALLFAGVGLGQPAAAQTGTDLPARPVPFTFVTDQGNLLSAGDAKKLEGGLRSYAEKTGTQVVVVTVPTLGSRSVADYGRALGTAWGVGQRDKNNGLVVLVAAKEHKVTIQPGSGLASTITPAVVSRVIGEMTPAFKQNNYFGGLRSGLNTLMVTANPSSAPSKQAGAAATSSTAAASTGSTSLSDNTSDATTTTPAMSDPAGAQQSEVSAPASSGIGMGTLLLGALVIGGVLFFIIRMFRGKSAAAQNGGQPNFYPNQGGNGSRPNQNPGQPNFYPNQGGNQGGNFGGGYPNQGNNSGGSGMGGILATGAAAAAGAYIGNRMSSHGDNDSVQHLNNNGDTSSLGAGAGAAAAGTGAAGDYFSGRGGNDNATNDSPDYFSGNDTDNSNDYFSADNSSYDDTSSSDTGGGGFDSNDDNSGSW